jgi:putative inorganic carbon (hco3(-)) transporter
MPVVLVSPFAGVLTYYWFDYLPPAQVYLDTLLPDYFSFAIAALTFFIWLLREKKTLPRPLLIMLLMAALLVWVNVTTYYALAPGEWCTFKWNRTIKVIGFAILTAQMLSTRARLEAFVWALVLSASWYAIPSAIKVAVSGGAGGIATGDTVEGAAGSFFGDRVTFSVVLAMTLPFVLYLGRQATLLPPRWLPWAKPAMLGTAATFMIASIGTFARTAVFASGAALLMLGLRSRRKVPAIIAIAATILALLMLAPADWFARMQMINHYQSDSSALERLAAWKWSWQLALSHPIVGGGFGVYVLDAPIFNTSAMGWHKGWLEGHNIFFSMMAEQGFVGFGLFCWLIVAIYRSCTVVQKRVRGREDLAWAADLARANQVALAAFVAGGMFVSIATDPFIFLFAGIAIGTRSLVERELPASARRRASATRRPILLPAEPL